MEDLTILIIGSGAREEAISHAYEESNQVKKIVVAPGNDFIAYQRKKEVTIDKRCSLNDPESILSIAEKYKPDLIEVAQDDALAMGTVDLLEKYGFPTFGPRKDDAIIEWDKEWSKEFMIKYEIPTSEFRSFNSEEEGMAYAEEIYKKEPGKILYVKAAGLCKGRGALKTRNLKEAIINIKNMKKFPHKAGQKFLIEKAVLEGEEFSVSAITDGDTYYITKSAQDNKTANNFDEGGQTGGMGANSPAMVTENANKYIEQNLIKKAIEGMKKEGKEYRGILYAGGILAKRKVKNIEFNGRWGDPEAQVLLPGIENYLDITIGCMNKKLKCVKIKEDRKTRVCVVGASRGYPNSYSKVKGKRIHGLEEIINMKHINVFGAGIKIADKKFYANGGRLFSVVAEGDNIKEAKQRAYSAIARVSVEGNNLHYRTDIGWRDLERWLRKTS